MIMSVWDDPKKLIMGLLQDLDPSLFQNIILGILAIFIPFAIVFLTDVLDSKKQRSPFEKMVLTDEVIETKKVFGFSMAGIVILAFFVGKDISIIRKLIAISLSIPIVIFLSKPLWKILRFSDIQQPKFEIGFLEKLNFSKIFRYGNKRKAERMIKAWESFWSAETRYNERRFTKIFINHIDNAVANKKYGLAVSLARIYKNNIDKRDIVLIDDYILPKNLEWCEKYWEAKQKWQNRRKGKRAVQTFLSKYFPDDLDKYDHSWNWEYFRKDLFYMVVKILLNNKSDHHQFFICFKNYIDKIEIKIENTEDKGRAKYYQTYISGLFWIFCQVLFKNIDNIAGGYIIWIDGFPQDWKITRKNMQKHVPWIILRNFLSWSQQRILNRHGESFDKDLTNVATGIFPDAHPELFPVFLTLYTCFDIEHAIQNKRNFYLMDEEISVSIEKSDEEIRQMIDQKEQQKRDETINLIFDCFGQSWRLLIVSRDDVSKEEFKGWKGYSEEQKNTIIHRVREKKLQSALDELNSKKIRDLCRESEHCKHQRKEFIELIELLLTKIS